MAVRVESFWGLILGCWKLPESAESWPFWGFYTLFLGILCVKSEFLTLKCRRCFSLSRRRFYEAGLGFMDCRGHLAPVEAASAPLKKHRRRWSNIGAAEAASAPLKKHPRQHHRWEADEICLSEWSDQILPVRGFASAPKMQFLLGRLIDLDWQIR